MAKFCKNCGRPLQEGEICNCTEQVNTAFENVAQQPVQPEPNMQQPVNQESFTQPEPQVQAPQQVQYQPAMQSQVATPNPNVEAGKAYLSKMFDAIKAFIKAPISAGSAFVRSCDHTLAFGFIVLQALLIGLLCASYSAKINGLVEKLAILEEIPGVELASYTFPTVKIFLIGAIASFGIACLLAAVFMLFVKIFKANTNYKYMLCVSGVNSIFNAPFILVGLLISILKPLNINLTDAANIGNILISAVVLPLAVSCIGMTLANFVSAFLLESGSSLTKDKAPYVAFLTGIVMSIAFFIVFRIVFPMCLPDTIRIAFEKAQAAGNFLESLF